MVVFVFLSALFGLELIHFFQSGRWVIHAGAAGFSQFPQPVQQNVAVLLHSLGMLLWVGIVIYQLKSRGKGEHIWVGRIGAGLMLLSLAFAWGPAVASTVPALHSLGGLTLIDITLIVNVLGIAIETLVGIFKARDRKLIEHRQHLMVAIMFVAAPGLYRALFIMINGLTNASDGSPTSALTALWAHELAACLAILAGATLLLSRTFSGHLTTVRDTNTRRPRPVWHKPVAIGMLCVGVGLILLFGAWTTDLLLMDLSDSIQPFSREGAPGWLLYFS